MEFQEVMDFLESKGNESTCKIYKKHGAPENMFGVKVSDLKIIQKKIKIDHDLAMELFDTGNSDAMYFAGLIADPKQFSEKDFEKWAKNSLWYMIAEYAVAWNLGESDLWMNLCLKWINSEDEKLEEVAWAALGCGLGYVLSDEIDVNVHKKLLARVEKEIHSSFNRTKYTMNNYVIALGAAVPELTELCKQVGERIGKVDVNVGDTACKVPLIKPYIEKIEARGNVGKKKKTLKC